MTKTMNRRALVAALSAGFALPAWAQESGRPRTIRYASSPGVAADLQSLDLYGAPRADGVGRPIVAFIHGGGWRIGDKSNGGAGADKARVFTERGYLYASLNYRLSPAVQHPAHIEDVAAGLAWLLDNAARFGGDPKRIAVMGHSAGAHLAALATTDPRRLGRHGYRPRDLRGAILLDGAGYDLTRQAPATIARGGFLGDAYAAAFGSDGALWKDASPVWRIDPAQPPPPFLILHVPRPDAAMQSRMLAEAIRKAGSEATLIRADGESHSSINRGFGARGDVATDAAFAVLTRWGMGPG